MTEYTLHELDKRHNKQRYELRADDTAVERGTLPELLAWLDKNMEDGDTYQEYRRGRRPSVVMGRDTVRMLASGGAGWGEFEEVTNAILRGVR